MSERKIAQRAGVTSAKASPFAGPRTPAQPYFCEDCGHRFYNLGWHAEVCGSSNYKREDAA